MRVSTVPITTKKSKSASKYCYLVPTRTELKYFLQLSSSWEDDVEGGIVATGSGWARGLMILCTGAGDSRFTEQTSKIKNISSKRELVLTGVCGALTEAHKVGAVIEPSWVMDEKSKVKIRLKNRVADGPVLVSSPSVVEAVEKKRELHFSTGAHCVDQESYLYVTLANELGIGLRILKVVLDDVGTPIEMDFRKGKPVVSGNKSLKGLAANVIPRLFPHIKDMISS